MSNPTTRENNLRREMDEAVLLGAFGRMMSGVSLVEKTRRYWNERFLTEVFALPPTSEDNLN